MQEIDITGWNLLSERQSTRSYTSPDGKWMVKVLRTLKEGDLESLQREQDISSYVNSIGIPTPEAGGVVKMKDGSTGALYQNIPEKKSLIRAISEDWGNMPSYIHKFVDLGTVIRSKTCDRDRFVPVEERMKSKLPVAAMYTDEEKIRISDFLDAIPKCDKCLHGDYHPGNFIFSGNDVYAIDLGLFSYGNPMYDWANWYFMTHYFMKREELFYLSSDKLLKCWEESFRGSGCDEEQVSILAAFYSLNYLGTMPSSPLSLANNKKLTPFFNAAAKG